MKHSSSRIFFEGATRDEMKLLIMEFFKKSPKPKDDEIHALAERNGINEHRFEEVVYEIMGEIFGAGEAHKEGVVESDVDPVQLKMGIKVEMEHTTNPAVSKRIALDHLAEIPDYYTRLKKMEKEAGVEH